MASSLRGAHNNPYILDSCGDDRGRTLDSLEWLGVGITGCYSKNWKTPCLDGFFTKCLISIGMLLLVLQSTLAIEDERSYESSGFTALPQDPTASAGPAHLLARFRFKEEAFSVHHTDPPVDGTREQPAFSSILTLLASTVKRPQTLVQSQPSPVISGNDNQTNPWPSEHTSRKSKPSSSAPRTETSSSTPSENNILSSSTGLTPSLPTWSLFPSQPASRSKLLSAFPDASISPDDYLLESRSSSAESLSSLSPSSLSSYFYYLMTKPSHNLLNSSNSTQLSTSKAHPVSAGYFQRNTFSSSVEPSLLSIGFIGSLTFARKSSNATSSTSEVTENIITKTKLKGQSNSAEKISKDLFNPSTNTKTSSSMMWTTENKEDISSISNTNIIPTTATIPSLLHNLFTASRDLSTKLVEAFESRVAQKVPSSANSVVTSPSAPVSHLSPETIITKASDSPLSPLSLVTEAQPRYRNMTALFTALQFDSETSDEIKKAIFSTPSSNETPTGITEEAQPRSIIHVNISAITERTSLLISNKSSETMPVPVISISHTSQSKSAEKPTYLKLLATHHKLATIGHTNRDSSLSPESGDEHITRTAFISNLSPLLNNRPSASAVFPSVPVTMIDSAAGPKAGYLHSFTTPLNALTSTRIFSVTSVPSTSAPTAAGSQKDVMLFRTLPSVSSSIFISPASTSKEVVRSLTREQQRESVTETATNNSLISSHHGQSSAVLNKSEPLSALLLSMSKWQFLKEQPSISRHSGSEALFLKKPVSTDTTESPSASDPPSILKVVAGVTRSFSPSPPVRLITKSTEFLKTASGRSFPQPAHTGVPGYWEPLTVFGNSTQTVHTPTTDATTALNKERKKAATPDIFTQAIDESVSYTVIPIKRSTLESQGYTGILSDENTSTASQPANQAIAQTRMQSVTVNEQSSSIFLNKDSSETTNGENTSPATVPGGTKDVLLSRKSRNINPSTHELTLHTFNISTSTTGRATALSTEESLDVVLTIAARGEYIPSDLNTIPSDTEQYSPENVVLKELFTKSAYDPSLTGATDIEMPSNIVSEMPTANPKLKTESSAFKVYPEETSLPNVWSIHSSPARVNAYKNEMDSDGDTKTVATSVVSMKGKASPTTAVLLDITSSSSVPLFRQNEYFSNSPSVSVTQLTRPLSRQGFNKESPPEDTSQYKSTRASDIQIKTFLQPSTSRALDTNVFATLSSGNKETGDLSSETPSSAVTPIFTLSTPSILFLKSHMETTTSLSSSPIMSTKQTSVPPAPPELTSYVPKLASHVVLSDSSIPAGVMSSTSLMSIPTTSSFHSVITEETTVDELSTAPVSTLLVSKEVDNSPTKNATSFPAPHTRNITSFAQADNTSTPVEMTTVIYTTQEILINTTLQLTTVSTTTVASTTEVPRTVTTMQPTSTTQMTSTSTTDLTTADKITQTTLTTTTSPLTSTSSTSTHSPKITASTPGLRTASPTDVPLLLCNITEKIWVKTVLSIHLRRNRVDNTLKQNLSKGLTQALQRAFNDSSAHAKVQTLSSSYNVTVGYYVASGSMVYVPSVVVETLSIYGDDKFMGDIRQFVPTVQSLPSTVAPWVSSPAISLQLKTVLRFVDPEDDIKSCSFTQRMEQRLENAFAEAESKLLNGHSKLSVQILSSFKSLGFPDVSLIYVVRNGSVTLNGTVSSNLLNQLTTELVGYFLFFPPLIIAEPLEYHNLNTSTATRNYWVITVIQDVDNASLESSYQSFASLMEQRLAELFVVAHQEGSRFRRATTVGSYTVQMVSIRRVPGPKSPAEMTYYVQHNGVPLSGTSAAKTLSTVDSQTMALTLGYFVLLQAEPVVRDPSNNLWIIAAVLAPIGVVTVIIIIITAVLCKKNRSDFKTDAIGNINSRTKTSYRRESSYYHQPVQGFDYAKQHLGQQGGDEEALPVTQETMVLPLPIRDAPSLSQEKGMYQDGSISKKTLSSEIRKSRLPSEDGSVISNESGKLNSGRGSSVQKVPPQQKMTKEEARKRTDPYDTSSGSLQLISIKSMMAPPSYPHPASSDHSQDSTVLNGEVSMALKQKSDIEHYRNKLRLKAKRKGYYDFPAVDISSKSCAVRHGHDNAQLDLNNAQDHEEERASTYVKSRRRHSQMGTQAYRSRQSLNSPGPSGTEMDLLVMRERSRRGIRNSGYDTELELIEEANVDDFMDTRGYIIGRQAFRFNQLSDMAMGSPPPPIPPRTGPPTGSSLRRSSSDIGPNSRTSECSVPEMQSQHDNDPYLPLTRVPLPAVTADQLLPHYSGNPITAVYAIPASRAGYSGYFSPTPPSSYRSPSWMSYPPEPEDLPHQWTDSVPLPGYTEAFPHPQYPQSSPIRLPCQYSLGSSMYGIPDQPPTPSTVASQESLTDPVDKPGTSLASISTAVLIKAIREEVAKLAKKQTDMFEFEV